jgi:hypothetical protein
VPGIPGAHHISKLLVTHSQQNNRNIFMKPNTTKNIIIGLLLLISSQAGFPQGFVNLNFESAKIIPDPASGYYPYGIAITNALPGWAVFGSTQGDITYNAPSVGSTFVTLWATNGAQISGNYSILLTGGLSPFPATISQTGLVPAGSESLLFEAQAGSSTLQVSLGGQNLTFIALSSGANYTLYGADVSTFANQTEQLMFSAINVSSGLNNWNIDNIQFSTSAIPEPSALALSALGGLFFLRRRWKVWGI